MMANCYGGDKSSAFVLQNDFIQKIEANGWVVGQSSDYNHESAFCEKDALSFINLAQPERWEKFCKVSPTDPDRYLAALSMPFKVII